MAIQFACQCGKTLKAADEHAGKRAKCNQCGQVVTIPGTPRKRAQAAPKPASPTAPSAKPASSTAPSAKPASSTAPSAKKTTAAETPKAANPFGLDDLFSSELPLGQPMGLVANPATSNPSPAAPAQAGGSRCPSCQSPLAAAAVLCVNCGYNLGTGKKTTTFSYTPSAEVAAPKKRPRSRVNQVFLSRLTSWKLWSGLGMMALSVAWFAFTFRADSIRSYRRLGSMAILFIVGAVSFINGLFDGDNAQ